MQRYVNDVSGLRNMYALFLIESTYSLTDCKVFVPQMVANQVRCLLDGRTLTVDELGYLYCFRHGLSVNQALHALGSQLNFADLLHAMPDIVADDGKVVLLLFLF